MHINICFTLDKNFENYILNTLNSIEKNSKNKISCFILGRNVKIKQKYKKIDINYIEVEKKYFKLNLLPHTTVSSLDRFLIPSLVPVDKIIYLDVDLIVNSDLSFLYNLPTSEKGIAAKSSICQKHSNLTVLIDSWVKEKQKKVLVQDIKELKINLECKCFNSGVMLLDLNKLRNNYFEEFVFGFVEKYGIPDQIILSAYANGDYFELPPSWNFFVGQESFIHKDIIHWAGLIKPWHKNCNLEVDFWKKYNRKLF
jgi:lipopolysaccharide biosynthesis glycosyltransferase